MKIKSKVEMIKDITYSFEACCDTMRDQIIDEHCRVLTIRKDVGAIGIGKGMFYSINYCPWCGTKIEVESED